MTDRIQITTEIDTQRVNDLLTSAFEGGSNYWADRIEVCDGEYHGATYGSDVPMAGGTVKVFTVEEEDQEYVKHDLTRERLIEAIALFAEKAPGHYGDWVAENDDAITADVFLQIATLGEVVFG